MCNVLGVYRRKKKPSEKKKTRKIFLKKDCEIFSNQSFSLIKGREIKRET